jgi:hypothetical protein
MFEGLAGSNNYGNWCFNFFSKYQNFFSPYEEGMALEFAFHVARLIVH